MPERSKRSRRKAERPRRARKPTSAARTRPTPHAGDARRLAVRIGFEPRRPTLLHRALTHRSAQQEFGLPSNERLEFLGDAVLGVTVATYFFRAHPDLPEGDLTKFKAVAVSESVLAEVARKLGLGRYLILSRGEEQSGGRDRTSILADALEAIFGAVYLDRGMTAARQVILRLLGDHFRAIERREHEPDYKTLLQEKIQEFHRAPPTYRMIKESGPDHDRTFVAEVRIGSRVLGRGVGKSKKQAEQAAASEAFRKHEEE